MHIQLILITILTLLHFSCCCFVQSWETVQVAITSTDTHGQTNFIDKINVSFRLDGNFCFSHRQKHTGELHLATITMSHRIRCESPDRCINYCALLDELSEEEDTLLSASNSLVMDSIVPTPALFPETYNAKSTSQLSNQATIGGVCPSNCTWAFNRLPVTTVTKTVLVYTSQNMETSQPSVFASSDQESLWLTVSIVTTTLSIAMVMIIAVLACMLCLRRREKSMNTKVKIHTATLAGPLQNQGMAKT